MIPCKERGALNRHRHPDGHTARRGVTLIFAGVTAVMVLTVSLSFYFTPASAGAIFTAPLCGSGSPPDYGFTLADQAPGSICAFAPIWGPTTIPILRQTRCAW